MTTRRRLKRIGSTTRKALMCSDIRGFMELGRVQEAIFIAMPTWKCLMLVEDLILCCPLITQVLAQSILVCMETVHLQGKVLTEVAHKVACRWDMEIN